MIRKEQATKKRNDGKQKSETEYPLQSRHLPVTIRCCSLGGSQRQPWLSGASEETLDTKTPKAGKRKGKRKQEMESPPNLFESQKDEENRCEKHEKYVTQFY